MKQRRQRGTGLAGSKKSVPSSWCLVESQVLGSWCQEQRTKNPRSGPYPPPSLTDCSSAFAASSFDSSTMVNASGAILSICPFRKTMTNVCVRLASSTTDGTNARAAAFAFSKTDASFNVGSIIAILSVSHGLILKLLPGTRICDGKPISAATRDLLWWKCRTVQEHPFIDKLSVQIAKIQQTTFIPLANCMPRDVVPTLSHSIRNPFDGQFYRRQPQEEQRDTISSAATSIRMLGGSANRERMERDRQRSNLRLETRNIRHISAGTGLQM